MDWLWPTVCAGCHTLGQGRVCAACRAVGVHRAKVYAKGLAGTWALTRYDHPLGAAMRQCKVHADRALAIELGDLMARRLGDHIVQGGFDALVPAPSTPRSRMNRGFSVAAILAWRLSRYTGVPVADPLTRRTGPRQATLDRDARKRNLQGRVRADEASGFVLLVDDVVTTGATADACVRELLGAGARRVWLATLCVVQPRRPSPLVVAGRSPVV